MRLLSLFLMLLMNYVLIYERSVSSTDFIVSNVDELRVNL